MTNKSFVIGALEGNFVAVKIFGYETPQPHDAKEANWLAAELRVSAGAWSGRVRDAFVTCGEISELRGQVERLEAGDVSEAHFEPMEPHLVLKLASDKSKIQVSGVAFDEPEGVNAIAFNWILEPKALKGIIKQLKDIEAEWPSR